MGKRKRNILFTQAGFSLIATVLVVDGLVLVGLWGYTKYVETQSSARANFVRRFLLDETTSSAFEVMEAALRRRLWEAPPDKSCLKQESFYATGKVNDFLSWRVDATYNPTTKVFEMTAKGTLSWGRLSTNKISSSYKRQVKVLDAADYLLLNMTTAKVELRRSWISTGPAGMIAGPRRIYTRGQLNFNSSIIRNASRDAKTWTPTKADWPDDYGMIVQADRIQAAQGLRYSDGEDVYAPLSPDEGGDATRVATLAPYSVEWGDKPKYSGQAARGPAIVTTEYDLAHELEDSIRYKKSPTFGPGTMKKYVYPVALFDGPGRPLIPTAGNDPGSYVSDPDSWNVFTYLYSLNKMSMSSNFTCLTDLMTSYGFPCNDSEAYPNGFSAWRKRADLEGVLFTKETEELATAPLDWDNMEALEEDALACGQIVTPSSGTVYEDCPIWDKKFLDQFVEEYPKNGKVPGCQQVTQIALDVGKLTKYKSSHYTDASYKDRLLRRVIYSKSPVEVKQTSARGLLPTVVNPAIRDRLSIWVVSEDTVNLRGYQLPLPPPIPPFKEYVPARDDTDAQKAQWREIFFNGDANKPVTPTPSIRLATLTPQSIHLISPQYVPLSKANFLATHDVKKGRLYPKKAFIYDDSRWENDAYLYGARSYRVENVVAISNSRTSAQNGFLLKGLWSGLDHGTPPYIHNQCLYHAPTEERPYYEEGWDASHKHPQSFLGNFPAKPGAHVPKVDNANMAKTSKFYEREGLDTASTSDDKAWVPQLFYPNSFMAQYKATKTVGDSSRDSDIFFTGLRLMVDFDPTIPSGKFNLQLGKYTPVETYPAELGDRKYVWDADLNRYWKATTMKDTPPITTSDPYGEYCERDLIWMLDGITKSNAPLDNYRVNHGRNTFQHYSPTADFEDVGALFGIELPIIQTRE